VLPKPLVNVLEKKTETFTLFVFKLGNWMETTKGIIIIKIGWVLFLSDKKCKICFIDLLNVLENPFLNAKLKTNFEW